MDGLRVGVGPVGRIEMRLHAKDRHTSTETTVGRNVLCFIGVPFLFTRFPLRFVSRQSCEISECKFQYPSAGGLSLHMFGKTE